MEVQTKRVFIAVYEHEDESNTGLAQIVKPGVSVPRTFGCYGLAYIIEADVPAGPPVVIGDVR